MGRMMDQLVDTLVNQTTHANPRDLRTVRSHPDFWYPIAWSKDVRAGHALGREFAGDPIVVYRATNGDVFALEDRCAHRQVKLSEGVVEGCQLRCGYHGWAYNSAGRCTDVPYLGRDKLPNGVRAYPCRESKGVILVFPGDPALADTVPIPALGVADDPTYKTRYFSREIGCHYTFMHENLMDMNHQFLHRKQMGSIKPRFHGRANGPDWVEARYSFARTDGKQPIGEALVFGERRGANDKSANSDLMTIRTEYPYQTLRIVMKDETPAMDLWLGYLPLGADQRRCRSFGLLSVQRPKKLGLLLDLAWPALVAFTERIFKEDRDIVETEQAAHDAQGGDWNQEVFPVIRDLRACLDRCGAD